MPAPETGTHPRRFQFTLGQMLYVLFLTALGMTVIVGVMKKPHPPFHQEYYSNLVAGLIAYVMMTWGTAFLILRSPIDEDMQGVFQFLMGIIVLFFGFVEILFLSSLTYRDARLHTPAAIVGIQVYRDAQEIYCRKDYDGDGVLEYAQSLRDLLKNKPGTNDIALIDTSFAAAEGLPGVAVPKVGYVFKVLTAQGSAARGGAMSYVDAQGNMRLGYAIVAAPAEYDGTGRDTFIFSNSGDIFYADLGPDTPKIFSTMTEFNPTPETWIPYD